MRARGGVPRICPDSAAPTRQFYPGGQAAVSRYIARTSGPRWSGPVASCREKPRDIPGLWLARSLLCPAPGGPNMATTKQADAIELLKEQHREVEKLFKAIEKAEEPRTRRSCSRSWPTSWRSTPRSRSSSSTPPSGEEDRGHGAGGLRRAHQHQAAAGRPAGGRRRASRSSTPKSRCSRSRSSTTSRRRRRAALPGREEGPQQGGAGRHRPGDDGAAGRAGRHRAPQRRSPRSWPASSRPDQRTESRAGAGGRAAGAAARPHYGG